MSSQLNIHMTPKLKRLTDEMALSDEAGTSIANQIMRLEAKHELAQAS